MRYGFCAVAILSFAALPAGRAVAQSGALVQPGGYGASYGASDAAAGSYGGGFIEMLMTGGDPGRVARPRRPEPVAPDGRPYGGGIAAYGGASYGASPYNAPRGYGRDPFAEDRRSAAPRAQAAPASGEPVEGRIGRSVDPRYQRQVVAYDGPERPGTIVVDTPSKFLYLVQPGGQALRYGIGVGRPGFTWAGTKTITRKAEWPDWTPPPEMLRRRPDLPSHMEGGPANPLGARAMYLGSSLYRIHGTNEPYTIGQSVSSGCIRMMNDDVVDLYGRVGVGTRVLVI